MPKLSQHARYLLYHVLTKGSLVKEALEDLQREDFPTTRQTVWRFWRKYRETGTIFPVAKRGRPRKLTAEVMELIEAAMQENDETTATEIQTRLQQALGQTLSVQSIRRGRRLLGWTYRKSAYCQLIRAVNQEKRLKWAREHLEDDFRDVIWTDETTVQLESHKRFCCRKKGQRPKLKPRAKHPIKLHVWAGISQRGRTEICVFEGKMDATLYVKILEACLLPFVERMFPDHHRFMQDNDPKHTSARARQFFEDHGINWWPTPPESPDANPIENVWHEMKEFLRREVKPKTKDALTQGILQFWATVDVEKCKKYIGHLDRVLPRIVEVHGAASGY